MGGEKPIRGNFGRLPGQPAKANTFQFPDLGAMTREQRIAAAAEDVRRYRQLVDEYSHDPVVSGAYADSIGYTLTGLSPDERDEVLASLDQEKTTELKEEK